MFMRVLCAARQRRVRLNQESFIDEAQHTKGVSRGDTLQQDQGTLFAVMLNLSMFAIIAADAIAGSVRGG